MSRYIKIGVFGIISVAMIFMILGLLFETEIKLLVLPTIETKGVVVNVEFIFSAESNETQLVTYSFTSQDGKEYFSELRITSKDVQCYEGLPVYIQYVESNPFIHEVEIR